MTVKIGGIEFENNVYDPEGDVLYLHVGDPADAVAAIGTEQGDGTFHAADGTLVGLTILNAKLRLERDGKIELTIPRQKLVVTDFGDAFEQRLEYPAPDIVTLRGHVDLGGIEFDDVEYDRARDILYLRSTDGAPASQGASAEFNPLEFDAEGNLVTVTIAEARRLLEDEGKIVVTLPDGRRFELPNLGDELAAA